MRTASAQRAKRSGVGRQAKNDVLIVIAEAAAEDVDPSGVTSVRLDLDSQPDRVVRGNIEVFGRQRRNFNAIDEGPLRRHPPALELAVLAALQFPPVGRIDPPLV